MPSARLWIERSLVPKKIVVTASGSPATGGKFAVKGTPGAGIGIQEVALAVFAIAGGVALFLGILRDGLTLEGVSADYLDFILGIAILVAMTINIYVGRVRKGSGRG